MRTQKYARIVGLILILVLGLLGSIGGVPPSSPLQLLAVADAQSPPSPGRLRGRVFDDVGNPAINAQIELFYRADEVSQWSRRLAGVTDGDGRYEIDGLSPGHYRVSFHDPHPRRYPPIFYVNAPTVNTATNILLAENATVEEIDGHFQIATGMIRGRVTDTAGQPLREITVYVFEDFDQDDHWERMDYSYYTNTDDSGDFVLEQLYDGAYRLQFATLRPHTWPDVCVDKPYADTFYGNTPLIENATTVLVQQGAMVGGIDAQLTAAGRIQGKLETVSQHPLERTYVKAISAKGGTTVLYCTVSGSDGRYDLAVPTGRYFLRLGGCPMSSDGPVARQCPFEFYDDVDSIAEATALTVHNEETITDIDARLAWPGYPPEARDDLIWMRQDPITGHWISTASVLANDRGYEDWLLTPQVLTAEVLIQPAHGVLGLDVSGYFTYVPNSNEVLSDTFQYQAGKHQEDGIQWSNSAVVTFTIVTPQAYLPLVQR